jgi:thioredoxin reductase (NADPH)
VGAAAREQGCRMSKTVHVKVLILGSGPAGYTAAIYATRAMLEPLVVAGLQPGGQMTITTDVENYPGFAETIQGPWLMEQMKAQAEHVGAKFADDVIVAADLKARPFRLTGDSGTLYTCDVLIVATGAQARWLGLPSEETFKGHGVSACATCDGFFYRGKDVSIVGGGNTAVEEALFLTKMMQQRLFAHPKIKVVWDTAVEEVTGTNAPKSVTGIKLRNTRTGATSEAKTDGLFVAIGHVPATELFKGQLEMDADGYILTKPDSTATAIPGVFAAGDVRDRVFRQAVTAAGMGCMAALEAEKYLAHHDALKAAAE